MKPAEMTDYWKNKNLYTSYFQFNVCRLCANESDSLTPIFGNYDESERLDLKIKKCLPVIMIQEDDIKPKQICTPCVSKLNLCSGLIESCIAADYKFEVLIQKAYTSVTNYPAQTQNLNYLSQPTWTDTNIKPNEKTDVLVIENLTSLNKTSEQEFVVMVEVKYKDSISHDSNTFGAEDKTFSMTNGDTIVTYVSSDKDLNASNIKPPLKMNDCSSILDSSSETLKIDDCSAMLSSNSDSLKIEEFSVKRTDVPCILNDTAALLTENSSVAGCSSILNSSSEMQTDLSSKIDLNDKNDYEPTYCNLVNSNYTGVCSDLLNNTEMYQAVEKAAPLLVDPCVTQILDTPAVDERCVKTPELAGKRYKCTSCDKSFARRSRCKAHIISHSKLRPFNCENCGKNFITKWECKLHQRIHIGVHACEFCGKAFAVRNKLERHRRVHTGEKPFGCNFCDKSFADKRNLDNHLRVHTGERPYVCQTCSDSFRTLTHLKDHQTVHTKEAQFCCYICDKRFKWKTNFHIHLKKHSSKDANPAQLVPAKDGTSNTTAILNATF